MLSPALKAVLRMPQKSSSSAESLKHIIKQKKETRNFLITIAYCFVYRFF